MDRHDYRQAIAVRLRARNLTLADVGAALGLSHAAVSERLRCGQRIEAIAECGGCDLAAMLQCRTMGEVVDLPWVGPVGAMVEGRG